MRRSFFVLRRFFSEKYFLKKVEKTFQKGIDKYKSVWYNIKVVARRMWEHSSVGRASALQAEGHRFEPYCFHHFL